MSVGLVVRCKNTECNQAFSDGHEVKPPRGSKTTFKLTCSNQHNSYFLPSEINVVSGVNGSLELGLLDKLTKGNDDNLKTGIIK